MVSSWLAIWRLKKFHQANTPDDHGYCEGELKREFWIVISLVSFIISAIFAAVFLSEIVIQPAQIDAKINMYQEENNRIEAAVDAAVESYMEHEEKVFNKIESGDSVTTLLVRFPELTGDKLVQKQIKVYQDNNLKIIALKEEKINLAMKRFCVYFGH